MLGWRRCDWFSISRRSWCSTLAPWSWCLKSTLSATIKCVLRSRARYTLPNLPLPSGRPMSKSFSCHCRGAAALSAASSPAVVVVVVVGAALGSSADMAALTAATHAASEPSSFRAKSDEQGIVRHGLRKAPQIGPATGICEARSRLVESTTIIFMGRAAVFSLSATSATVAGFIASLDMVGSVAFVATEKWAAGANSNFRAEKLAIFDAYFTH